jgi:hypothetical protein
MLLKQYFTMREKDTAPRDEKKCDDVDACEGR